MPYGILDEQSDIRAHVGVASRSLYVFRTAEARNFLRAAGSRYAVRPAYQPGVDGMTALGWKVPWKDIPGIRKIASPTATIWGTFDPSDTTTDKGRKAVAVVHAYLRNGRFPLWIYAEETTDTTMQVLGTDLIVYHTARIQVKCDWYAGEGGNLCTGNLYLQTAERNPLKRI